MLGRKELISRFGEDIIFLAPFFDEAISGYTIKKGIHVIYNYDKVVQLVAKERNSNWEDAEEAVSIKVVSPLSYYSDGNYPMIQYTD